MPNSVELLTSKLTFVEKMHATCTDRDGMRMNDTRQEAEASRGEPRGMERRVQDFEWTSTSLGSRDQWPPVLAIFLDLIFGSTQPMFVAWGPDRVWLYNDAMIAIAGRKHPHALGRKSAEVWAEAWDELGPLFDTVFAGKGVSKTGFKIKIDRNGQPEDSYFDFSFTPIRDGDGAVLGLFGVSTETTARVLHDRRLLANAESERDRLFEMSRDLFGVATFDGMLKTINPAWSRQLERSQESLLATPFAQIIHPEDLPTTAETVAALKAGKPVHQFHVRLLKADGTAIPFAWSAVPDPGPDSGSFFTVGRDISEQVAAEADLKLAQDALRQAQKMESIGQLTGGIAHDFNNLLGGISGSLEMLQKRLSQGRHNEVDRYIVGAQGAAKRAAALTHRLLAFSRRQTLEPKPTDVKGLVANLFDLIARTVGPQIEMEIRGSDDLWHTLVDPNQLENALLNLCINARDAMPDGGKLVIQSSNHELTGRAAAERNLPPGSYVAVCVSDNGTGMTDEVKERAVDPFFTTKPLGQGTGLGLSMIYGFVRQSGGQVRIESQVGGGTSIYLYLPRYDGSLGDNEEIASQPEALLFEGKGTIVVIDDEPSIRMLAVDILEDLGYTVLEAADGPSGLRLIEQHPETELLVTDVGLPGGMNGRQVADAARAFKPALKVLFVTGYAETTVWNEARPERGMQVLTKPFTVEHLALRVAELLEGER
jgi:PAS domain S-box-containing protein